MGERLCPDGVLKLTCDGEHGTDTAESASFFGRNTSESLVAAQRLGWKLWVRVPNGHRGIGHLGPFCSGKAAR